MNNVPTSETKKTAANKRFMSLKNVYYKGWRSSHQDLQTYINQLRGFFDQDPNDGKMVDHKKIMDGHATQTAERTANNLNSSITSKSRPWFKLTIDLEMLNIPGVRAWLDEVQKRMYLILEQSNIYDVFQSAYEELVQFGTACFIILKDFDDVIIGRSFTAGEYYLGTDGRGRIDTFAREDSMTVDEMVNEFGIENVSLATKAMYEDPGQRDNWVKYRHLIQPNRNRIEGVLDKDNMEFESLYWEVGEGDDNRFLAKRGFKSFRCIAPRWKTSTTNQIYGHGPGWFALGDIKELQKMVFDRAMLREKLHNPPTQEDASVEGHSNMLPGGTTKVTTAVPNSGVRAAYQVPDALVSMDNGINEKKMAIDRFFFLDVFSIISSIDRANVTALQVAKMDQERIMLMGSILNKLDKEMLSPTIDLIYNDMLEMGLFPPAPPEVEGITLNVQYTSVLAQALRSVGIESMERAIGFVGQFAPNAIRIIDQDEVAREAFDMAGAPAKTIKTKEQVAQEDAIAQQQQEMMQNAAMSEIASKTAKNLADSDTEGNNALTQLSKAAVGAR